jgi:hypothetical protein
MRPLEIGASNPAVRRGWCLGDEGFRQELLQRGEGKLEDHHSEALRARLRQETSLSVKTIAGRMHLGPTKSANVCLYGWMRQSVPVGPSSGPTRTMKASEPCYGLLFGAPACT